MVADGGSGALTRRQSADAPAGVRHGRCSAGCVRSGHRTDSRSGCRRTAERAALWSVAGRADRSGGPGIAGLARRRHGRRGVAQAASAGARRPPGCGLDTRSAGRTVGRCATAGGARRATSAVRCCGSGRCSMLRVRVRPTRRPRPVCGMCGANRGWRSHCSRRRCAAAGPVSAPTAPWTACSRCSRMAADLADRMPRRGCRCISRSR